MLTRCFCGLGTVLFGLSVSGGAFAQATPAVASPPAAVPAPSAATPTPSATPAVAPAQQGAVPPGYMLVPVADGAPATNYNVQYPQGRGALPPGMELPYEEGDPIPSGYRLREQPRRGLVIAGSILVGVPWALSTTAAAGEDFDNKSGFLLVPGIGPWLMLLAGGAKDRDCTAEAIYCDGSRSGLRAVLTLDGLVQTAGTAMFVVGLAFPRKRLVREDVTVSFAPTPMGRDGYGIGAVGTF
jgi:hypothetical protein